LLFNCFFSPLEFSIEIISGKYFTVLKTACFEPLSEVAVLHHRAAVRHFKTYPLQPRQPSATKHINYTPQTYLCQDFQKNFRNFFICSCIS